MPIYSTTIALLCDTPGCNKSEFVCLVKDPDKKDGVKICFMPYEDGTYKPWKVEEGQPIGKAKVWCPDCMSVPDISMELTGKTAGEQEEGIQQIKRPPKKHQVH